MAAYTGEPLSELATITNDLACRMTDFQQDSTLLILIPYYQYMLNMMGRSENPVHLEGESIRSYKEFLESVNATKNFAAIQSALLMKVMLSYFFRNYKATNEILVELKPLEGTIAGHVELVPLKFFTGLNAVMLYRETRKRKWLGESKRMLKMVTKWWKDGNPNCKCMSLLLEAEIGSLAAGYSDEVVQKYEIAAKAGKELRFLHYQALANELCGLYQLGQGKDSTAHFNRAREYYAVWESEAKVHHLETVHPEAFAADHSVVSDDVEEALDSH